jgi:hypothetical protein
MGNIPTLVKGQKARLNIKMATSGRFPGNDKMRRVEDIVGLSASRNALIRNLPVDRCRQLRWIVRCVAAGLGAVQIFLGRNTFGPDPRSYLEIAHAILRHDWAMVTNAYWGPLYCWLLAGVVGIAKPTLREEIPLAHALAFPIYLAGIAAFELFWSSLLELRQITMQRAGLNGPAIPPIQLWVLGYSLFIWLTVGCLVVLITPDLCVTTIALLASGILLRMEITPNPGWGLYAGFGICLGLGYFAKAILFPMGLVFLSIMILSSRVYSRRQAGCLALAALSFVLIATPEIAALSRAKHRFTFSDSAKLNLAWFNYGLPYRNWQGEPAGSGTPAHPTRKIYEHPAVYEFNGPLRASYPPWFDPSYWNEGLSPKFRPGRVARHVTHEIIELGVNLMQPKAWLAGMLLIFLGADVRKTLRGIAVYWPLLVISLAAYSLYSLTLIQSRFLPPWTILLWGSLLAGVRLRKSPGMFYRWLPGLVCLALIGAMMHMEYGEARSHFRGDATPEYATAEALQQMGLQPGENVGAIGFDNDAHWAYLAKLNVVAEIDTDETCLFWSEAPAVQNEVLKKFAQSGARVVVANSGGGVESTSGADVSELARCARPGGGWREIPGSPNQAFFLK